MWTCWCLNALTPISSYLIWSHLNWHHFIWTEFAVIKNDELGRFPAHDPDCRGCDQSQAHSFQMKWGHLKLGQTRWGKMSDVNSPFRSLWLKFCAWLWRHARVYMRLYIFWQLRFWMNTNTFEQINFDLIFLYFDLIIFTAYHIYITGHLLPTIMSATAGGSE